MSKAFVDTNVLVYANDADDPRRRKLAVALLDALVRGGAGVVSTQVLIEYASTALRKLRQRPSVVDEQVDYYSSLMDVVVLTPALIRRAIGLAARHTINYFDALIVVGAEHAGCTELYSEDLSAGQSYAGLTVINPFAS